MEIDQDVGLGDGFFEVDIRCLIGDAAVLIAWEKATDILGVNTGAAFAQFEAGAIDHGHGDNVAADGSGIGFSDEIQNGDGADDFAAVDRALQHQRRSRLGAGDQMHRDIEPNARPRSFAVSR